MVAGLFMMKLVDQAYWDSGGSHQTKKGVEGKNPFSVDQNSSDIYLIFRNPPYELILSQEKFSHNRSNNIESKNTMWHIRDNETTVLDEHGVPVNQSFYYNGIPLANSSSLCKSNAPPEPTLNYPS